MSVICIMDDAVELNEIVENSAAALHLKRKDSEASPNPDSRSMTESTSLYVSPEADWCENMSSFRFSELIKEGLEGENLVGGTDTQPELEPLMFSHHSMNDTSIVVEELTLKNFKFPNVPPAGSSDSGIEMPEGTGLWQNFYKMVGKPKDVVSAEPANQDNRVDVENASMNHFWIQRSLPQNQLKQNYSKFPENLLKKEKLNNLGNPSTTFPRGIHTKVLPTSGFPQFLVKSTLKGKGVSYRDPGVYGVPGVVKQGHHNERPIKDAGIAPDTLNMCSSKPDDKSSLYGGSDTVSDDHNRICSRAWLKPSCKLDKVERLHIFKQILKVVDTSHSEGFALQQLRPSYFFISSTNQVEYAGSFAPHAQSEYMECAINMGSEHHLKRKRYLNHGIDGRMLLSTKDLKLIEQMKSSDIHDVLEAKGELNEDSVNAVQSFESGNSKFDFEEHLGSGEDCWPRNCTGGLTVQPISEIILLEETWYTSPEVLNNSACSFTSNIYSLGVLMFELFCCFESWEAHAAAMSDLRHRILPPNFLSESPQEASFCLWLLHPESSLRPKAREILLCDLICQTQNLSIIDQSSTSFDEEDTKAELLLDFLLSLKEQKAKQAEKLIKDIGCLKADIEEVEKGQSEMIEHLSSRKGSLTSLNEISLKNLYKEPCHLDTVPSSAMSSMKNTGSVRNIDQLANAYFSMRSEIQLYETNAAARTDKDILKNRDKLLISMQNIGQECYIEKESDSLGVFFDGLCKYAQYSKFEVRGTLRNRDVVNSANVICSLSFDRDEEYFAAAGVSKKIKIFEYGAFSNDAVDSHYPVIEMSSKSKLSCVCWNSYIKNYLASASYDGAVQLWDASTGQSFTQHLEHQKRAWSVDFSQVDPTKLASGSDDCSVKLWSINERSCTDTIRNIANVCCVQFSAHCTHLLAFGSADYKIYCYDLRSTKIPWCTLVGHGKTVSYVKFIDSETLVSASTDNTLKIWDLNKSCSKTLSTNACSLTLRGHTNEKNFVGLSVSSGYITCGSETNEVYAYYKSFPMPITSHRFGSIDPISGQEIGDDNGQFVSSVCWRRKSNMVVAANSSGSIKLLQMV